MIVKGQFLKPTLKVGGCSVPSKVQFYYHSCWIRDSSFIALAFCNMGFGPEVRNKIPYLMRFQKRDGSFSSQKGEWDSTGQVLFIVLEILFRFGSISELSTIYGQLRKGWLWIEKARKESLNSHAPHDGLLPAGISAEHFGPNDHYFWDNFWSLAGMIMLKKAAKILGKESDVHVLQEGIESYKEDLQSALAVTVERSGDEALPASPYRKADTASIGTLVALSPLELFSTHEFWVQPTVDFLCDKNLIDGLFFQSIIHTGFNTYLSLQLARALLTLGDNRYRDILEAVLRLGGGLHTWPEAVHPITKGGCMGDGDHGWAAAEFLNIVRNLFVHEEHSGLALGRGISREWIESGRPIAIEGASTRYGTVSWRLEHKESKLHFSYRIQRSEMQVPASLLLYFNKEIGDLRLEIPSVEVSSHSDDSFYIVPLDRDRGDLVFSLSGRKQQ